LNISILIDPKDLTIAIHAMHEKFIKNPEREEY
jgi:hypothetical protein